MRNSWAKGHYTPKYPDKYMGDLSKIVYRSSWELECFRFFDNNMNIIRWGSEPCAIPYMKPTDKNKLHKYYPDFYVEYINKDKEVIKEIIEVKPKKQMSQSTAKSHKTRLTENLTYAINIAKWTAAKKWCEDRNITFKILNETQLFKG